MVTLYGLRSSRVRDEILPNTEDPALQSKLAEGISS